MKKLAKMKHFKKKKKSSNNQVSRLFSSPESKGSNRNKLKWFVAVFFSDKARRKQCLTVQLLPKSIYQTSCLRSFTSNKSSLVSVLRHRITFCLISRMVLWATRKDVLEITEEGPDESLRRFYVKPRTKK